MALSAKCKDMKDEKVSKSKAYYGWLQQKTLSEHWRQASQLLFMLAKSEE